MNGKWLSIGVPKYTLVPKDTLFDNTLSLSAKGLYVYLYSCIDSSNNSATIHKSQFKKDLGLNNKQIQKYLDELFPRYIIEFQVSGTMYEDMEYIVTLI